ncbi:sugar phosphate isomerase/epimerase family protein [Alkalihalobacillus sp. NPDC078783]
MNTLSLTSWSLNRVLGPLHWTKWDEENQTIITEVSTQPEIHTLLELPGLLSEKGFDAMEIIHPHFPTIDDEYLQALRSAVEHAGIRFDTLLLDYGDISSENPIRLKADLAFIKKWIRVASKVGASHIRVVGGEAHPDNKERLAFAAEQLTHLAEYGKENGVHVITENFHSLASTAENCLYLNEQSSINGLISDFGNFSAENKLSSLRKTVPHSTSIHVKAQSNRDGTMDKAELIHCLDVVSELQYSGPLTLVYDGPGDMWEGIAEVRKVVSSYL